MKAKRQQAAKTEIRKQVALDEASKRSAKNLSGKSISQAVRSDLRTLKRYSFS